MSHIDYIKKQLEWEQNILAVFYQATASQITDGKLWYPDATKEMQAITHGMPDGYKWQAVCAILSPRVTWKENKEGLKRIYRAVSQGSRICPTVAGVRRNVAKAWDTANDGITARVTGPKVSAFYANLCGDYQRVTLDVWAARAAGLNESEMTHIDRKRYVYLERAYQHVAHELGFLPAELQAIVWIVQRGHGEGTMAGTNQPRWTKGE